MNEQGINSSLEAMFDVIDAFCKDNDCFYDIVHDEADQQGYVIKDRTLTDKLINHVGPLAREHNVHVDVDPNRKDGVLFTFTLSAIQDGHWKKLTKKRKPKEFSIFADPEDTEKVRAGKHMAQQHFSEKLDEALDKHVPTVAVDLDGTLAKETKFDKNKIGDPRPGAKKFMERLQQAGCRIIINTVRGNKKLIKDWLTENEIPYDYINENPDQPADASDKIIADIYVDDKAEDARGSLSQMAGKVFKRLGIKEDQYKHPTRKHHRDQSAFPSSFGKTKSFGGLKESGISGSSIPPQIEKSSNVGLASAQRSNASGEPKKVRVKRKDLSDLPKAPTAVESMFDEIEYLCERTNPSARAGRVNDPTRRTLNPRKVAYTSKGGKDVPAGDDEAIPSGEVNLTSPFEVSETQVNMDDEATREREDPHAALGKKANLRPLGLFGPADKRQRGGGTPDQQQHSSNVRVQHAPDRAPGAAFPEITTSAGSAETEPGEGESLAGADPLNKDPMDDDDVDVTRKLDQIFGESYTRPWDGYELLTRLVNELGLATRVKKVTPPNEPEYVEACNGVVRLRLNEGLSVYKRNRLLGVLDVDLGKNTVVIELADKIRNLVG